LQKERGVVEKKERESICSRRIENIVLQSKSIRKKEKRKA
jgi:hypothetical protein